MWALRSSKVKSMSTEKCKDNINNMSKLIWMMGYYGIEVNEKVDGLAEEKLFIPFQGP